MANYYLDGTGVGYLWKRILERTQNSEISYWQGLDNAKEELKNTAAGAFKFYLLLGDTGEGSGADVTKGYGVFSTQTASELFGTSSPRGFSLGDILAVTHSSEPSDDVKKCSLTGLVLPTQDAKSRWGSAESWTNNQWPYFPGADGLETVDDKLRIEQIPQLFAGENLKPGEYNADECLEPGVYFKMTKGRSMQQNDPDEYYLLVVTARTTYPNGYQNALQIAYSLKYSGKAHYRYLEFTPNKKLADGGIKSWQDLGDGLPYSSTGRYSLTIMGHEELRKQATFVEKIMNNDTTTVYNCKLLEGTINKYNSIDIFIYAQNNDDGPDARGQEVTEFMGQLFNDLIIPSNELPKTWKNGIELLYSGVINDCYYNKWIPAFVAIAYGDTDNGIGVEMNIMIPGSPTLTNADVQAILAE